MATSYTAKFSSACSANAPCIFDTNATQATGAVTTGIGLPAKPVADAAPLTGATYIGGAAQTVLAETSGDPNLP